MANPIEDAVNQAVKFFDVVWNGWTGLLAHPNSPSGGGGPGFSTTARPSGMDVTPLDETLHPESPKNRTGVSPKPVNTTGQRTPPGTSGTLKGERYVVYTDEIRVNGSRAWRNNNPGNMIGPFATSHGAIGKDGQRFAIFPDEQTGLDALEALLKSDNYSGLTIEEAMTKYAPPSENDTADYIKKIEEGVGVKKDTKVGDLTDEQMKKYLNVIRRVEGWIPGKVYKRGDTTAPVAFRTMLGDTP